MYTGSFIKKQRCRDGVINDFLSQYRNLLAPVLFLFVWAAHKLLVIIMYGLTISADTEVEKNINNFQSTII